VTDKPDGILTGNYIAPEEITLNALFVQYVGGEASYVLLTAAPADWTGNYLITYGADAAYVMKGIEAGKSYEATKNGGAAPLADTGMVLNGDTLVNVPVDYVFAAEAHDSAYAFRSVAMGSYLADRKLSQSYTLRAAEAYADDTAWKLSVASNGVVTLKSTVADANRSVLSFYKNGTGSAYYFRAHASVDNIRLWKEVNTGTPYYTTVLADVAHEHSPGEPVEENVVPATCTEAGSYDLVVYCTVCGEELSRETVTVEPLGHSWGAPAYVWTETETGWSCTGTVICANDASHAESETVNAVYTEITAPSYTAPGAAVWTATFTDSRFAEQVKEVVIDPLEPIVITLVPGEADGTAVPGEPVTYSTADADNWSDSAEKGKFFLGEGQAWFCFPDNPYEAPEGWTFIGWKTEDNENAWFAGASWPASNTTYTAVWGREYSLTTTTLPDYAGWGPVQETAGEGENIAITPRLTEEAWQAGYRLEKLTISDPEGNLIQELTTAINGLPFTEFAAYAVDGFRVYPISFKMPASDVVLTATFLEPAQEHECPCAKFKDMPAYGTPEHEAIDWAFTHEPYQITSGVSKTKFGTGVVLTRAQAATFLYAAAGKPAVEGTGTPFSDVPEGQWYTIPVQWAAANGCVSGYTDGTFRPDAKLTRGQILVILYAWAGKPSVEGIENPYTDAPVGQWYTKAAIWAYDQGIERGADGVFAQGTKCTREVFVLYLYRYMEHKCLLTD
jgi:hypothetical protein